ncbi:MAG TPA: hypothetical protein VE988_14470 [Gemmataceae bacterium]|nr:hypothetical protein [Gemmataceae bacterium]
MTPTALTLRLLRRRGYLADVCERWVPIPDKNIRRDLFGAFDVAAIHRDLPGVLGVQTTSLAGLSARVKKLRSLRAVQRWVKAGNAVQCHGWLQRASKWRVKIVELRADDLCPVIVEAPRRRRPARHVQGELFASEPG